MGPDDALTPHSRTPGVVRDGTVVPDGMNPRRSVALRGARRRGHGRGLPRRVLGGPHPPAPSPGAAGEGERCVGRWRGAATEGSTAPEGITGSSGQTSVPSPAAWELSLYQTSDVTQFTPSHGHGTRARPLPDAGILAKVL